MTAILLASTMSSIREHQSMLLLSETIKLTFADDGTKRSAGEPPTSLLFSTAWAKCFCFCLYYKNALTFHTRSFFRSPSHRLALSTRARNAASPHWIHRLPGGETAVKCTPLKAATSGWNFKAKYVFLKTRLRFFCNNLKQIISNNYTFLLV